MKPLTILLFALCTHCVQTSLAQVGASGYDLDRFIAHACRNPYRTFDAGVTFQDLTPLIRYHRDRNASKNPMLAWYLVGGRVLSIPSETSTKDGLLIQVDKMASTIGTTGNADTHIIHLRNYPHDTTRLIDHSPIACFALPAGRYQYRTIQGAIATVLSYDHGALPTPDQLLEIENKKLETYRAQVAAHAARTNAARQKMSSQNLSNYTITPPRPK